MSIRSSINYRSDAALREMVAMAFADRSGLTLPSASIRVQPAIVFVVQLGLLVLQCERRTHPIFSVLHGELIQRRQRQQTDGETDPPRDGRQPVTPICLGNPYSEQRILAGFHPIDDRLQLVHRAFPGLVADFRASRVESCDSTQPNRFLHTSQLDVCGSGDAMQVRQLLSAMLRQCFGVIHPSGNSPRC